MLLLGDMILLDLLDFGAAVVVAAVAVVGVAVAAGILLLSVAS